MKSPDPNERAADEAPYVVDTLRSPFSVLRPLDLRAVRLTDAFWAPRREAVRLVTLLSQYRHLDETGRLDNFRRAAGFIDGVFQGRVFSDTDVYKWLEAASWILATDSDSALQVRVDETIALVAAAQDDDGYLDTYFVGERAAERWSDLEWAHELYCAGHLFQAGVANYRATGARTLLEVATRFADLITRTFHAEGRQGADGHPEIEMALVELARATNDARYLRQAEYFIDQRGRRPATISGEPYAQDHAPLREQRAVVGHAVRALYLYSGAADVYLETGDETLRQALDALWADLHAHKIYVTGGVGARHEDEAVGDNYELPNRRAYAETCAAVAEVMWNWRMLLASGEARYADALETALYNGVLSGISLEGTEYFYENPLADRGGHRRQPWHHVSCCPPNVARLLASLPGYFYSTSDRALWVHLYASNTAEVTVPGATRVTVRQKTEYPWQEDITLEVEVSESASFDLMLRIPAWCESATAYVNGEKVDTPIPGGRYFAVNRRWRTGDVIRIHLTMPVRIMTSHPHVLNDQGRVAITRGPLVYCLEQADHPDVDVWDVRLDGNAVWESTFQPDTLGGVVILHAVGTGPVANSDSRQLYAPYERCPQPARRVSITAIPYYSWANREAGPMQVWLPIAS